VARRRNCRASVLSLSLLLATARAGYPIILDSRRSGSVLPLLSLRRALEYRHTNRRRRQRQRQRRRPRDPRAARGDEIGEEESGKGREIGREERVRCFLFPARLLPFILPSFPLPVDLQILIHLSCASYRFAAKEGAKLDLYLHPPTSDSILACVFLFLFLSFCRSLLSIRHGFPQSSWGRKNMLKYTL